MAKRLHNYLLTHRKRSGLTKGEVAFLLGARHKTKFRYGKRFAFGVMSRLACMKASEPS